MHIDFENSYDLSTTLECGQAFRWRKIDGWYSGVIFNNNVKIRSESKGADKRLTVFAAVVFLISIIVLWLLVRADGLFQESRLATLSNQVQRLSKLQSPKLVLVGGSNLPYGMNSEMLSEATGMPVMNMGAQATLPLEFMLELIKPQLHSGDVVIFAFEYGMYISNAWSSPMLLRTVATDIGMVSSMSWRQIVTPAPVSCTLPPGAAIQANRRPVRLRQTRVCRWTDAER